MAHARFLNLEWVRSTLDFLYLRVGCFPRWISFLTMGAFYRACPGHLCDACTMFLFLPYKGGYLRSYVYLTRKTVFLYIWTKIKVLRIYLVPDKQHHWPKILVVLFCLPSESNVQLLFPPYFNHTIHIHPRITGHQSIIPEYTTKQNPERKFGRVWAKELSM